jgi:hypothetical protein
MPWDDRLVWEKKGFITFIGDDEFEAELDDGSLYQGCNEDFCVQEQSKVSIGLRIIIRHWKRHYQEGQYSGLKLWQTVLE